MKKFKRILFVLLILGIGAFGYIGYNVYQVFFASNINAETAYLYIRTGSNLKDLYANLEQNHILKNEESFKVAAEKMKLEQHIHAGRFELKPGMNNRNLINLIKSGNQKALSLKIHNIRTLPEFSQYIGTQLECDSASLKKFIFDEFLPKHEAFNKENIYTLFIPNTYEIYWNTPADEFVNRMYTEYQKFWNPSRLAQAEALHLSPQQVTILASIVDSEALFDKEMPRIAGLYLNRLQKGIKLQADPTVIFAHQDFTIRRVTNKLLGLASPYNTYYVTGLPPGPIMMPSINAIDAVLKHEKNDFIYMCAKEDFSGYHNFATSVAEHQKNAKLFQEALNKRQIYK